MDKRSDRYNRAVASLTELLVAEGFDAVSRAYAEATWEDEEKRFIRANKVKYVSGGHVCVPRLRGAKRCPSASYGLYGLHERLPASDHVSEWKRDWSRNQ
jgi:hypothetical protein